jgi:transcriptional regulator with XRE-family HTH domain
MNFKEYQNKSLKNVAFKKESDRHDLAFEIGQMILEARIVKGLTQMELAQLVGTKQSSIARLENGKSPPSLSFLEKIAKALKTHLLIPKFAFLKPDNNPIITINYVQVLIKKPPSSIIEQHINSVPETQSNEQKLIFSL